MKMDATLSGSVMTCFWDVIVEGASTQDLHYDHDVIWLYTRGMLYGCFIRDSRITINKYREIFHELTLVSYIPPIPFPLAAFSGAQALLMALPTDDLVLSLLGDYLEEGGWPGEAAACRDCYSQLKASQRVCSKIS